MGAQVNLKAMKESACLTGNWRERNQLKLSQRSRHVKFK
ncbi:MAG: hypothetical protein ACJAZW_001731 [Maritalea sp.]|jgi:hypothetical protein